MEVAQCMEAQKVWEVRGLVLWRPLPPPGWFSLGDWAEEVEGRPSDNDVCLGWLPVVREDAATTTTTQEGGGAKAFFGTELQELALREGRPVPAVVSDAIAYIERHGLQAVGLFRIDVTSLMNNLTRDIDAGQPIDLDAIANPHAAANIIKRFLRRLPEPLFPFSVWNSMAEAISTSQTPEESREKIKAVMQQLPEVNLKVMHRIFGLLSRVAQHSHSNLMPASNLASMIGPNVLYPHPSQQDHTQPEFVLRDVNTANAVVETIITSLEFFFPPEEAEVPDSASADSVAAAATAAVSVATTTTASHESTTKPTTQGPHTTLVVSPAMTAAATTHDARPSGLLGVPGVMLEDNALQRRRSNINVLKQFFEEKAPPPQPASALRPTAGDATTTTRSTAGAEESENGRDGKVPRLSLMLKASGNQGTATVTAALSPRESPSSSSPSPSSSPSSSTSSLSPSLSLASSASSPAPASSSPSSSLSLASVPSNTPLLVAPKSFVKVWDNSGLGSKFGFLALWKAVPPTPQYVALGNVVTTNPDGMPPATNTFRCVHVSAVKSVTSRKCLWKTSDSVRQTLKMYRSSRQSSPCSLWIALPEDGHGGELAFKTGLFLSFPSLDARTEQLFGLRKDCDLVSFSKDNPTLPKREFEWEGGEEIPSCHLCGAAFTILRRRHRCRSCGQVFCGTCSVVADKKTVMSRFKLELSCLPCKKQKQVEEKESQESLDLLRKWREEQRQKATTTAVGSQRDALLSPRSGALAGNTREKKEAFEGAGAGGGSAISESNRAWKNALNRNKGFRGDHGMLLDRRAIASSAPASCGARSAEQEGDST